MTAPGREAARPTANDLFASVSALREVTTRLVRGLGALRVIVFGSRARGEGDARSDLDLLVIARAPGSPVDRMIAGLKLLDGLAVPADVFVFTPEEAERFAQWPGHVVRIALREGVVLHDAA